MAIPSFKLGQTIYFYKKSDGSKTFKSGVIRRISYNEQYSEYTDESTFTINDLDYIISTNFKKIASDCLDEEKTNLKNRITAIDTAKANIDVDSSIDISKL